MRGYRYGVHTKSGFRVHLSCIPKCPKPVLVAPVAIRVRDLIDQITTKHKLTILPGKVARDHVHVFVSYRPHQDVGAFVEWLNGISSRVLVWEFARLRKMFCGKHFWARVYMTLSSCRITDDRVAKYIAEQEGEPVRDDSQFQIDSE